MSEDPAKMPIPRVSDGVLARRRKTTKVAELAAGVESSPGRPERKIGDYIQGRWEIHDIKVGGMGIVYIVYDHEFRERFAAKTFKGDDDRGGQRWWTIKERFELEARAWLNVDSHPNIVEAQFIVDDFFKPLLFLEYVSGGDLSTWIGRPQLTEDIVQVLRFAIQFCDGMIHAKSKGIQVHRDIKPANCLITQDSKLKVADFGLAKVFDGLADTRTLVEPIQDVQALGVWATQAGTVAGTPPYMAPEQFDGKHLDVRADIYGFGVMLFQMVTGKLPFLGPTWEDFAQQHKTQSVPALDPEQSALDAIIETCLAKNPSHRFSDFGVARKTLVEIYKRFTGHAAPRRPSRMSSEVELIAMGWKGFNFLELNDWTEAIACFDRALELEPYDAEVLKGKSKALLSLPAVKEVVAREQVIACYDRVLKLHQRDWETWRDRGLVLWAQGSKEEAIESYNHALELNPKDRDALFGKGIALLQLGRIEEGLASCYLAYESYWHDSMPLELGHVLTPQWFFGMEKISLAVALDFAVRDCFDRTVAFNQADARAWFLRGTQLAGLEEWDENEILACLDHSLKIDARQPMVWLAKASRLKVLGRTTEAVRCMNRALKLNPTDAVAWKEKGMALAAAGKTGYAVKSYARALAVKQDDPYLWFFKGEALRSLNRAEEAIACYDRVTELAPRYRELWQSKGLALLRLGKTEEAIACYDREIQLSWSNSTVWRLKADALIVLQKPEQALTCYDRAVELDLPYAEGWLSKDGADVIRQSHGIAGQRCAKAWLSKGDALVKLGRTQEALCCFNSVLKLEPRLAVAWVGKGDTLRRLGRSTDAIDCYDRALELNPNDGRFWAMKGGALGRLKRWAEALPCYDRALDLALKTDDASHAWHLKGLVLLALGRTDEALSCCDRSLALNPRDGRTWFFKGMALGKSDRFREALGCFEEAKRLGDPKAAEKIALCRLRLEKKE